MKKAILFTVLTAIMAMPILARASQVITDVKLDDQVQDATDIIKVVCLNQRYEEQKVGSVIIGGANVYDVKVVEVIKPETNGQYKVGDETVTLKMKSIAGVPILKCDKETETILMLTPRTSAGYVSTIGLSLGRFDLVKDKTGVKRIKSTLFQGSRASNLRVSPSINKSLTPAQQSIVNQSNVKNMTEADFVGVVKGIVKAQEPVTK